MATESDSHLFVDLDGTLIRTDLLFESALRLVRRNPLYLLAIPFWLLRGRAWLKQQLARRVILDPAGLPYNAEVLSWLREERARGRGMTLITASNQRCADQVGEHLGLFDQAIGSDAKTNLKGEAKLRRIRELAGGGDFAYAGDSRADVPIWEQSSQAVLVDCPASISDRIAKHRGDVLGSKVLQGKVLQIGAASPLWRPLLRAMRPHQWLKNTLVFVALILSHRLLEADSLLAAALAFVVFCLCASSVYLLNDLLDLDSDRAHQTKCKRPFAAGDLPLAVGLASAPVLLLAAFLVALALPAAFGLVLLGYWLLTCLYSFALKRIFLLDTITLALLFTLRVAAGAAAIEVDATNYLIAFSLCFFLGLALVKRVTELVKLQTEAIVGRAYRKQHEKALTVIGSLASLLAVIVFAFYINAQATTGLYRAPWVLWLIVPLLLVLLGRIWLLARTGKLHEDPVLFAVEDRLSQLIVLATGCLIWLAA